MIKEIQERDFGDSQREARMMAAKTALDYIENNGLQFTIRDEIENRCVESLLRRMRKSRLHLN